MQHNSKIVVFRGVFIGVLAYYYHILTYRGRVRVWQRVSLSIETEAEEGQGQTQKAEEEGDSRRMKRYIVFQVNYWLPCTHH